MDATGKWECLAVEASYKDFIKRAGRTSRIDPNVTVPIGDLIESCKALADQEITLAALDIPLSRGKILRRRVSDNEISSLFGSQGCATHSPSSVRPGRISEDILAGFQRYGYKLATNPIEVADHTVVETYPHPALLSLMRVHYRVPYKISKSKRYWPTDLRNDRLSKLSRALGEILAALSKVILNVNFAVPKQASSFSILKPLEDKIDALVCAWVGIKILEGEAVAIGDDESAIWLPGDARALARPKNWSAFLDPHTAASPEFMEGVEDLPVEERAFFGKPMRPSRSTSARTRRIKRKR